MSSSAALFNANTGVAPGANDGVALNPSRLMHTTGWHRVHTTGWQGVPTPGWHASFLSMLSDMKKPATVMRRAAPCGVRVDVAPYPVTGCGCSETIDPHPACATLAQDRHEMRRDMRARGPSRGTRAHHASPASASGLLDGAELSRPIQICVHPSAWRQMQMPSWHLQPAQTRGHPPATAHVGMLKSEHTPQPHPHGTRAGLEWEQAQAAALGSQPSTPALAHRRRRAFFDRNRFGALLVGSSVLASHESTRPAYVCCSCSGDGEEANSPCISLRRSSSVSGVGAPERPTPTPAGDIGSGSAWSPPSGEPAPRSPGREGRSGGV